VTVVLNCGALVPETVRDAGNLADSINRVLQEHLQANPRG
jgi:hypothetical protein